MAIGSEFTDPETLVSAAFSFPADDEAASSPLAAKLPRRLRRRLSAEPKAPSTIEEIEAKLKEADLRRQAKVQMRLRRSKNTFAQARVKGMLEQGDLLPRTLAKAYEALEINERTVKAMSFEDLVIHIESASTIKVVKALLERLEELLVLSRASGKTSRVENIDHLLKRIYNQSRRNVAQANIQKKSPASSEELLKTMNLLPRYPARVVLCGYMILGHPEAVFSGKKDCETALAESAVSFIREFELLVRIILDGPVCSRGDEIDSSTVGFRSQLEVFDRAWCSYLYGFVIWKAEDAKSLKEELVNTACQLKLALIRCSKMISANSTGSSQQVKAIQKQVIEHQNLIREKLHSMSGIAGIERLDHALSETRSRFPEAENSDSPVSSPEHTLSHGPLDTLERHASSPSKTAGSSSSIETALGGNSLTDSTSKENEALVNEIMHEHNYDFVDKLTGEDHQGALKGKLKETVERAFWDAVTESMKQDQPDFSWVLKLIKEVKDELCEMSPQSWRQEIAETINVENLSRELSEGVLDMVNLRKVLEFALETLRQLSSPSSDDDMRTAHSKLLNELEEISQATDESNSSFALSLIKGLQFVLQQLQVLKREIGRARIRLIEPIIKGPTGVEYLKKSFAERYGPPSNASSSIPLTARWLSSVHLEAEEELQEHINTVRALLTRNTTDFHGIPQVPLRAGGAVQTSSRVVHTVSVPSGKELPECCGEKVDTRVRLGLLKLVSKVDGMQLEELPETLNLNFTRLRQVQSQFQKIIVISTSTLVLRQALLTSEGGPLENLEGIISDCSKQLSQLLESNDDAGISEIIETLSCFINQHISDPEKVPSVNQIVGNLLVKSLQSGNPIFNKVSQSVYLAARGFVFGGVRPGDRELAEAEFARIGAASPLLIDTLYNSMQVLVNVAVVSRAVHGAWYEELLNSM